MLEGQYKSQDFDKYLDLIDRRDQFAGQIVQKPLQVLNAKI